MGLRGRDWVFPSSGERWRALGPGNICTNTGSETLGTLYSHLLPTAPVFRNPQMRPH